MAEAVARSGRAGRTGGRQGRAARQARAGGGFDQPAWRQPRMIYPPIPVVSADELESIHQASLQILEEMGIEFLNDEARQIIREAGADVDADGVTVRIDRALVDKCIATAPSSFTLHARNPERNLEVGRRLDELLRGRQRAQLRRHGRGAATGQPERLPEFRQARADAQCRASVGRLSRGTD